MKSSHRLFLWLAASAFLALGGCEIETVVEQTGNDSPAGSLVINEVFTLSATEPTRFNWIEFLNASNTSVDVTGWTLEYTTYQIRTNVDIAIFPDGHFEIIQVYPNLFLGFGKFRVPFASTEPPRNVTDTVAAIVLPPQGLMTIVDNESRMKDVTDWGPPNLPTRYITTMFYGQVDSLDTLFVIPDSVAVVRGGFSSYGFFLDTTDEMVLRNPLGEVVDVVRYGNYHPPSPDPYPGNQSLGMIPRFESFYRYAGGYKSNKPWGNTANDFNISNQFVRPIPHWYSQPHKR